jgi:hypothetical protein
MKLAGRVFLPAFLFPGLFDIGLEILTFGRNTD